MFARVVRVSERTRKRLLGVGLLSAALTVSSVGLAQDDADALDDDASDTGGDTVNEGTRTAPGASSTTGVAGSTAGQSSTAPSVRVETGAPRPPAQTPGIQAPTPPAGAPPAPPVIKVGGHFILSYFHPFGMEKEAREQFRPEPKPYLDVLRASIFMDSKISRFGVHMEFRMRDKQFRDFYDGTAWMEEAYGSFDLIPAESEWGPAVLKWGKAYSQFGRFWDDSMVGNIPMRDGLKLDPNYGLSLEGTVGARKMVGAKYYGQYFIIDGGTNSSLDGGRDTIGNDAPLSGHPKSRARRRNMFVGRIEPFIAWNPLSNVKLGGSIANFTADFGPTKDQENVTRYGGDLTAMVGWAPGSHVAAWAEYTVQNGRHTHNFPFGFSGPIMNDPYGRPDRAASSPGRSSDNVHYIHVGGRIAIKNIMLRYNMSQGEYRDVKFGYPSSVPEGIIPSVTVRERQHVPGILIPFTQQLFLMFEYSNSKRKFDAVPASAFPMAVPDMLKNQLAQKERTVVIDNQFILSLHSRI
jgi:hypothetical protein